MSDSGRRQVSRANPSVRMRRSSVSNVILWIVQGLLAVLFLLTGSTKLLLPIATLMAQVAVPLPGLFIRFIGVVEVAGALGLILPSLTGIKPFLTPLAACGLVLEMVGATIVTIIGMGVAPALFPLFAGLLAAYVVYGRWPDRAGHAA